MKDIIVHINKCNLPRDYQHEETREPGKLPPRLTCWCTCHPAQSRGFMPELMEGSGSSTHHIRRRAAQVDVFRSGLWPLRTRSGCCIWSSTCDRAVIHQLGFVSPTHPTRDTSVRLFGPTRCSTCGFGRSVYHAFADGSCFTANIPIMHCRAGAI